jgi:hypothetical protein
VAAPQVPLDLQGTVINQDKSGRNGQTCGQHIVRAAFLCWALLSSVCFGEVRSFRGRHHQQIFILNSCSIFMVLSTLEDSQIVPGLDREVGMLWFISSLR